MLRYLHQIVTFKRVGKATIIIVVFDMATLNRLVVTEEGHVDVCL